MMDSIDLSARKFGTDNLLDFPLNLDAVETGRVMHDAVLPNGENQLHLKCRQKQKCLFLDIYDIFDLMTESSLLKLNIFSEHHLQILFLKIV